MRHTEPCFCKDRMSADGGQVCRTSGREAPSHRVRREILSSMEENRLGHY